MMTTGTVNAQMDMLAHSVNTKLVLPTLVNMEVPVCQIWIMATSAFVHMGNMGKTVNSVSVFISNGN